MKLLKDSLYQLKLDSKRIQLLNALIYDFELLKNEDYISQFQLTNVLVNPTFDSQRNKLKDEQIVTFILTLQNGNRISNEVLLYRIMAHTPKIYNEIKVIKKLEDYELENLHKRSGKLIFNKWKRDGHVKRGILRQNRGFEITYLKISSKIKIRLYSNELT